MFGGNTVPVVSDSRRYKAAQGQNQDAEAYIVEKRFHDGEWSKAGIICRFQRVEGTDPRLCAGKVLQHSLHMPRAEYSAEIILSLRGTENYAVILLSQSSQYR
jgi:hypothetical protein